MEMNERDLSFTPAPDIHLNHRCDQVARLLVQGASLGDIAPLLLGELGIGIIYGILGYLLFAVFEVVAKRLGT